jgi:hypothetical protein
MGSYIALAADRVTAEPNAIYMVHNAQGMAFGDHNYMRKSADIIEGMSKMLATAYVKKTGKTSDEIKSMMDTETFLFGSEIKEAGFADEIAGETSGDKADAVMRTRAAVASADDLIKRLSTDQDAEQAAACIAEFLPKPVAVGSVQAAGPIENKGVTKMTPEEIAALKAAAYQEGIQAERKRVSGLVAFKGINADCDKAVEEAVAAGKSYEDVAPQLAAAAAKGASKHANGDNAPEVQSGTVDTESGAVALSEEDKEAMDMFGLSAEDMKAYKRGKK